MQGSAIMVQSVKCILYSTDRKESGTKNKNTQFFFKL